MAIQEHNAEHDALQTPDRQAYEHYHEPLGDFGAFNGQFEQGLAGRYADERYQGVEGWELQPVGANAVIERVNGGLAGNWRIRGGNAGAALGGAIESWKYFPVDEDRDYYISAAFITDNAAATVYLGCDCFDAAKANLGQAYVVNNVASGQSWLRYQRNIGPNGDVAWPAGTRYARIRIFLQGNAAIAAFAYVDDVQFGQLKKTYSPLIRLVNGIAEDAAQNFSAQAFTGWANSTVTLTLEEPGYIWWGYQFDTRNGTAIRTQGALLQVFIDAAGEKLALTQGYDIVGSRETNTLVGRSDAVIAVGAHTVDVRVWVVNAGDTINGEHLTGYAFYTRAF